MSGPGSRFHPIPLPIPGYNYCTFFLAILFSFDLKLYSLSGQKGYCSRRTKSGLAVELCWGLRTLILASIRFNTTLGPRSAEENHSEYIDLL